MTDTNNTDGAALLPVTAEDREAAAGLIAWHNKAASDWKTDGGNDLTFFAADMPDAIRKGVWDNHDVVQAFARHRKDHSLPGDVGMREALEGLSLAADEINGDIDLQVNGDHSEEVDVNGEYYVTLSAAKVDALNKAICVAQRLLKKVPARPANPTVEKILTLAKRKYHFQPTIGAVLRSHMPTGTTGHDWDDKEAFSQAIAILDLIPDLAALSSPLPATQEDAERSGVDELRRLLDNVGGFLDDFARADLDEGAADAVTVGMVYQQQAQTVVLPRIRAALSATPAQEVDETERLRGIVSGLRGALEHLENANEALAYKRSRATYLAMEAEARDELIMLDEARRNARAALSDRPQAEGEVK